jgi:hypothetical protein
MRFLRFLHFFLAKRFCLVSGRGDAGAARGNTHSLCGELGLRSFSGLCHIGLSHMPLGEPQA